MRVLLLVCCFFFSHTITFQLLDELWSQVSSPLPPGFCFQFFIAHRVQQSHSRRVFHRVLLTHALALSARHIVHKKTPPRIYTSMHSGGFELTKLTYTRLEDNLIRHRGDQFKEPRHLVLFLGQNCHIYRSMRPKVSGRYRCTQGVHVHHPGRPTEAHQDATGVL